MKRREFIKKGSVLSAGVLMSTSVLASITDDFVKKNVRIAIIGCGSRGTGLLPIIQSIEGLETVAVCDVLKFRLNSALENAGDSVKGYNDYREVFNNRKIDAVLIATSFYTHEEIALAALEAGKHVYCEKTTAKGIAGVHSLVKKVEESKVIFQTGHQYHSSRLYQYVVALIKSGEIGDLSSFECQWYRKGDWRNPVPNPSLERAINWRMYREYSGGLTAELSSHQIDFVNWVLEENPKKIIGTGGIDFFKNDGRETYDNTHLLFEYPCGIKASFKCLTGNIPGGYEIKVIGRKGVITIGPKSAWIKYYDKNIKSSVGVVDGVSGATSSYGDNNKGKPLKIIHMDPSRQDLVDFKDAIKSKKQPISDVYTGGHTAIAVQLSLDAMYTGATQY